MNIPKLTCAPEPPPICSVVDGQWLCLAPPVRCVASCADPANDPTCTVVCCAAFAPAPVPTLSAGALGLTVLLVAVLALIVQPRRLPEFEG